jgi:hypothetical protein
VVDQPVKGTLMQGLANGDILCKLINKIYPNTITRIHEKPPSIAEKRENIQEYLNACKKIDILSQILIFLYLFHVVKLILMLKICQTDMFLARKMLLIRFVLFVYFRCILFDRLVGIDESEMFDVNDLVDGKGQARVGKNLHGLAYAAIDNKKYIFPSLFPLTLLIFYLQLFGSTTRPSTTNSHTKTTPTFSCCQHSRYQRIRQFLGTSLFVFR